MYTYELLEAGCYYLVKEKEDSMITLIKVAMETDHCLFIMKFEDPRHRMEIEKRSAVRHHRMFDGCCCKRMGALLQKQ
jgi:hypothetical protein